MSQALSEPFPRSGARGFRLHVKRRSLPWFPLLLVSFFIFTAIFGPYIAPYPIDTVSLGEATLPPVGFGGTMSHPLGTDQLGRDLLSLLLHGARPSLIVAIAAVVVAGSIGTTVGVLAGHLRGRVDSVLSRLVDITMSIPALLLVILLSASLERGLLTVVIAISCVAWVLYARVIRSETLSTTQRDFVLSARASGAKEVRIMARHILPNVASSIIVLSTVQIGSLILIEASLSFLGLGIQPPQTSWGLMVASGRNYITTAWWLSIIPGAAIMITVLGINLLGNWIGDRLDPVRRVRTG